MHISIAFVYKLMIFDVSFLGFMHHFLSNKATHVFINLFYITNLFNEILDDMKNFLSAVETFHPKNLKFCCWCLKHVENFPTLHVLGFLA